MKRLQLIVMALLASLAGMAQVDAHYGVGAVPVVNNRVTFEKTIPIPAGQDGKEAFGKAVKWMEGRFVTPTVISSKTVTQDDMNDVRIIQAEEWLVFRRRWWELDRSRITYLLEMTSGEKGLTLRMTRIRYLYEEERGGGQRFTAEEWITDDECFNDTKTKFLRGSGKFRIKTIDLFDQLASEVEKAVKGS